MRAGSPNRIDDREDTAIDDRPKTSAVDDPMGRAESKQQYCSEAHGSRTAQHQNNDLLHQMTLLCAAVQSLGKQMQNMQNPGKQMQDGVAAERIRRKEDHKNMEEMMSAKMEEGFKGEPQARQQAENEMLKGLKNEESARLLVQRDLAVMKEETKNLKMGRGSTVCSEASTGVGLGASGTFARPPTLAFRYNEIFIPRKMEFKGWVTDYTRSSFHGITNEEVMVFIVDLLKIIPGQFHWYIDWDKSRKEQGSWPTKTNVNMWFKNETNLATMIGQLKSC